MGGLTIHDKQAADVTAITALVANYARSIDAADAELAARLWDDAAEISLVHPRGTERGWTEVRDNFYRDAMGATFSARRLVVQEVQVTVIGDAALAMFDWEFRATVRGDGSPLETSGRETQVLRRTPAGWRILHIHYSGPATTDALEGF